MVDWQGPHLGLERAAPGPGFYPDTRGCSSNAVYEQNMGLDVPTYALWNGRPPDHFMRMYWKRKGLQMRKLQGRGLKSKLVTGLKRGPESLEPNALEEDGATMRIASRYWGAKNALRQRDPTVPRLRLVGRKPKKKQRRFDDWGQLRDSPGDAIQLLETFIPLPREGVPLPQPASVAATRREESGGDRLRRRTAEFNARLRRQPKDEALWLEFVRFQEEAHAEASGGGKRAARQVAERQLAVLDRAVAANPLSVDLRARQMALAAQVLPPEAVEDLWDVTLRRLPHSAALWLQFIAWRRSSFALYTPNEVRYLFAKCIQRIAAYRRTVMREREALAAQDPSGAEDQEADSEALRTLEARIVAAEEGLLRILWELADAERAAGYGERALGLLQAAVEFNCFAEDSIVDTDDHLRLFRQFWDAEVPRIGEAGAVGWRFTDVPSAIRQARPPHPQWMGYAPMGDSDFPQHQQHDRGDNDTAPLQRSPEALRAQLSLWHAEEQERTARHWLPCRPVRDPQLYAADPDRVVLWDDVESYLVFLYSPRLRLQLLYLLLEFLGVPVMYSQRTTTDPLVQSALLVQATAASASAAFAPLLTEASLEAVFEWQPTPWGPDGAAAPWQQAKAEFVRGVLRAGAAAFPSEAALGLTALRWEAALSLPHALAVGRDLLQRRRTDLVLWVQYALLLRRANDSARALEVFHTMAAQALPRASPEERAALGPWVFRNFAETVLLPAAPSTGYSGPLAAEISGRAISVLVAGAPDGTGRPADAAGPIQTLQAVRAYESELAWLLDGAVPSATPNVYMGIERLFCAAMLQWLTKGWEAGLALFHRAAASQAVPPGTTEHQYLWLLYLRYAHLPAWIKQRVPPKRLLQVTRQAADLFPTHPLFVALHVRAEVRHGLVYRCRAFLGRLCDRAPSPLTFLYAALAELHALPRGSGTRSKVRNVLERGLAAVEGPGGGPAALWLLYLHLDGAGNDGDTFKGRLYRAVDACPSVKAVWLSAFHRPDTFDPEELQEVINLVVEKELHVRTFLEEVT